MCFHPVNFVYNDNYFKYTMIHRFPVYIISIFKTLFMSKDQRLKKIDRITEKHSQFGLFKLALFEGT